MKTLIIVVKKEKEFRFPFENELFGLYIDKEGGSLEIFYGKRTMNRVTLNTGKILCYNPFITDSLLLIEETTQFRYIVDFLRKNAELGSIGNGLTHIPLYILDEESYEHFKSMMEREI